MAGHKVRRERPIRPLDRPGPPFARADAAIARAMMHADQEITERLIGLPIDTIESHNEELGLIAAEARQMRETCLTVMGQIKADREKGGDAAPKKWGESYGPTESTIAQRWIGAAQVSIACLDRAAKLNGLDAPQRVKVYAQELDDLSRESGIPAEQIAKAVDAVLEGTH